ncbi:MAG: hypothetical protein FJ319_13825 [SAR202 cluster bacterium]|nr:hypothetical protein [SAR202 cluster bacterium]
MVDGPAAEARVVKTLEGLGIPYEILRIDPAYADTVVFCEKYGYEVGDCGNTIIVAAKKEPKQYSACIVRGSDRLDVNKAVKRLMGVSRLSFASADETRELTGMEIGGVTPFDLPAGVPIYADAKLMPLQFVILGSGSRASKVKISPEVLRRIPGAQVIEGLSLEPKEQGAS